MEVGILTIEDGEFLVKCENSSKKIASMLSLKGYDVPFSLSVNSKFEIEKTIQFMKQNVAAIIVCGNTDVMYDYFSANYSINKEQKIIEIDEIIYAFMPVFSDKFIIDFVIPSLNSKCKTFYNTVIFKTFNKTEKQLREILKDCIKNKNKITFRFIESLLECEVQIKYSSKTSMPVVESIVLNTAKLLAEFTYANTNVTLSEQVMDILKVHNKKLCIAESFTGGAVIGELIKIAGASACVKEGIVSYSNESKIKRLNVEPQIIQTYGAVSIETVYEMAANILMDSGCDISLATTGNAGPTAEKEGDEGVCFIAVGNKNGIHIYKYKFDGDRETVIQSGVKAALFHLYKKLNESEFIELLKLQENQQKAEQN